MKKKISFYKFTWIALCVVCLVSVIVVVVAKKWKKEASPLKVQFLAVEGDATLIEYTEGGQVHYGMIDVGQKASKTKNAATYFAEIADHANQERVLDFCVITHAHRDHYYGLHYLEKYNIKIKKLYVNSLFYDESVAEGEEQELSLEEQKKTLKEFLEKRNDNNELVEPEDIILVEPRTVEEIVFGELSLHILGSALERDVADSMEDGYVNMHSMMCTVDYSKYKYIFMGDVYQDAYDKIVEENMYYDYLVAQDAQTNIICKIGHHGRRDDENYKEESEQAIYHYIFSGKYKRAFCIANRHYKTSNTKFAKSVELQKLWNDGKGRLYCLDGYKMDKRNVYTGTGVKRENRQDMWAVTSTTTLGMD